MIKFFIFTILTINLLTPDFALAQNFSQNDDYLIDQADVFLDNLQDKKNIINDLGEVNKNSKFVLKILTLKSFENKSPRSYCNKLLEDSKKNQIILIYTKDSNEIRYCYSDNNSTGITDNEFNYMINEIVQPNIDGENLIFAFRFAIREISVASTEDIAPKDYKPNVEIERDERNKQIIIFLFIIIFFSWLAAYLGRTKSWWLGGMIGFGLGLFIWCISKIWFFMPLFLVSGLVYDYFVSRHYKEYRTCERGAFWCTIEEMRRNRVKKKRVKKKKKRKTKKK